MSCAPGAGTRRPMPLHRLVRPALLCALLIAIPLAARADVVVLKDGRRIEGDVISEQAGQVVVRTGLGELSFPRAEVVEIVRKKTARAEFAEREAAARTAGEFFALGEWASGHKLGSLARKAWKRAIDLDPDHAEARAALGFVRHEGEWLTTAERDARVKAAEEARRRAAGLVPYGDAWVTPLEKERLERGLILHEGKWITPEEKNRLDGLEYFGGRWLPRAEAVARGHAGEVVRISQLQFDVVTTGQVLVAGPFELAWLEELAAALDRGRAWFDSAFGVEPGLQLYGGALAEFYVWGSDARPYVATVEHFAGQTPTATPEWAAAVSRAFGLYWYDPFPLSSARSAHRERSALAGHCAHHLGHLMLGRLGYDGRLLAPWYDESLAALVEYRVFAQNAVFCQERGGSAGGGTAAKGTRVKFDYDPAQMRSGQWRETLRAALEADAVVGFDRIARKDFSDLELLDVAAGMGVLAWLETLADEHGAPALGVFHASLRKSAPAVPLRVLDSSIERGAAHDAAFRAATGLGLREADEAWRRWLLKH